MGSNQWMDDELCTMSYDAVSHLLLTMGYCPWGTHHGGVPRRVDI